MTTKQQLKLRETKLLSDNNSLKKGHKKCFIEEKHLNIAISPAFTLMQSNGQYILSFVFLPQELTTLFLILSHDQQTFYCFHLHCLRTTNHNSRYF